LGTINDARFWVEYCNLEGGTYYSDLRAGYGHKEPYRVKYWCLGNEVDGSPWIMGYKNAEDYCKIAIEAAKAMKATDPGISLIANGASYYESTGIWIDWNRTVISGLTGIADYLSIHRYWENSNNYYEYIGQSSFDVEEKINTLKAQVLVNKTRYPDKKPLSLSVDEWAPFGQTVLSSLAVAEYLNSFVRHSDFVKMANFTLMTSLLANDRTKGTYKSPLFYTFKAFSNNCLGSTLDTYVQCDTFNTPKYKGIPYLDVTSVRSEGTNTVYINVVNRHKENLISAEIMLISGEFAGKAEISLISGQKLDETYTYDRQSEYVPVKKWVETGKNSMKYSFPPHSFTQIRVDFRED
jgi:alpha-N-arabinofuranosidase